MFYQKTKNQDIYTQKHSYLSQLNSGFDVTNSCSHRSLYVQGLTGFDINFGMVFIKSSLTDCPIHKENSKEYYGYTPLWDWHVWNEDKDGIIYDSHKSLKEKVGNPNLDIDILHTSYVDFPTLRPMISKIEGDCMYPDLQACYMNSLFGKSQLKSIIRNFTHKMKKPDIIYVGGIGQIELEEGLTFCGDDWFNWMLDGADEQYGWTGGTQTHIEK